MHDRISRARRVVAILANVKQYRGPFYLKLAASLARSAVDFRVLYSDPSAAEASKGDNIELPASLGRKIPCVWLKNQSLLLQIPPFSQIARADLVIVIQASSYLLNYPLLFLSALRCKRVAFWGHGRNLQGDPDSLSERSKRWLVGASDWWFAYTEDTRQYLNALGVSSDKITVIENAVDTRSFAQLVDAVTEDDVHQLRAGLNMTSSAPLALYCGSLYSEKRLEFLVDVARILAKMFPGFRLLVIGSGPEQEQLREYTRGCDYIVQLSAVFGEKKALYFRAADVFLNPGMVGLGILDSFAAGLPIATTRDARHSPEIAYLKDGLNGLITSGSQDDYATKVASLLRDPVRLARMAAAARDTAARITIENMVENVKAGILACLAS